MVEVNLTHKALADIEAIAQYLSEYSPSYASRFVVEITKRAELLRSFPEMGRVLPEIDEPEVRELIYQHYRIVYHIVSESRVDIITIQHSSRDIKRHLSDD
jgi:toxin ParE1/3/4